MSYPNETNNNDIEYIFMSDNGFNVDVVLISTASNTYVAGAST